MKSIWTITSLWLTFADPAFGQVFFKDPATEAVWVRNVFGGREHVSEWRADGKLLSYRDAFSPFKYMSPRRTAETSLLPTELNGVFGIVAHSRGFYPVSGADRFVMREIFDGSGTLGCSELPTGRPCSIDGTLVDARGKTVLAITNEKDEVRFNYWDNGRYRSAQGVEIQIERNRDFDFDRHIWSKDQSRVFGVARSGRGNEIEAHTYSQTGRQQTLFKLQLESSYSRNDVVSRGGDVFVVSLIRLQTGGEGLAKVFSVSDPFGSPTFNERATIDGDVYVLGADQKYLLTSRDSGLFRTALSSGATEMIRTCRTRPVQLTERLDDVRTWVACDGTILHIANGSVAKEIPASGRIVIGSALATDPENFDVVVLLSSGKLERYRTGQSKKEVRLLPRGGPETSLSFVWEDKVGACGVSNASPQQLFCERAGTWTPTALPIGVPTSVSRFGDHWWAVSKVDGKFVAFRRSSTGDWDLVHRWDDATVAPKLIANGTKSVGAVLGSGRTQFFDGTSFRDGHSHSKTVAGSAPAISVEGILYDTCKPDALSPDRYRVCHISLDGKVSPLRGSPELARGGTYVPLSRGLVLFTGKAIYAIRDELIIDLGRLYGELAHRDGETFFKVARAGEGQIAIEKLAFGGGQVATSYFLYDGVALRRDQIAPSRIPPDGGIYLDESDEVKLAWQGVDGVWRAKTENFGDFAPLSFALNPATVLFGRYVPFLNYVNDAVARDRSVLMAVQDGIWSCPIEAATPLESTTTDLPVTADCTRQLYLPLVKRFIAAGAGLVAQQGQRIVYLKNFDGPIETVSVGAAWGLARDRDKAVWVERGQIIGFDPVARTKSIVAPPFAMQPETDLVSSGLVCSRRHGVFLREDDHWRKAQEPSSCLDLVSIGGSYIVAAETSLFRCSGESCTPLAKLPVSFFPSGKIGDGLDQESIALVLGQRVFSVSLLSGVLQESTPLVARGSAILAAPERIGGGLVSMNGAGLLALPSAVGANEQATHFRLE